MINKPFTGISVPKVAQPKLYYSKGGCPQVGDLVSKRRCDPDNGGMFIDVVGMVVGIHKQYGTPIVHWVEEGYAYGTHPSALTLINRGQTK